MDTINKITDTMPLMVNRIGCFLSLLLLCMVLLSSGCSAKADSSLVSKSAEKKDVNKYEEDSFDDEFGDQERVSDPLEGYNRALTSFNDKVYVSVFNPISKAYSLALPKTIRVGVSNLFSNIKTPLSAVNNILQLKIKNGVSEISRFTINSTLGIFGLMDIAKDNFGIEAKEEDFGQTLGYYGVGSGFHIVLPFYGPSNVRDIISLSCDSYVSPLSANGYSYQIPDKWSESMAIAVTSRVNKNSLHLGEYESLKKDSLDFYIFLRDAYEQSRNNQIKE
jgi:phospholipid-binding lipoprotein MlaA